MTWENWIATQGEAFKRGHLGAGTLDAVKGAYEAGFKDGGGERAHVPRDSGYDKGKQDGHKEGQLKGWMEAAEEKQRSERAGGGGGSGPKVLKKGDAGQLLLRLRGVDASVDRALVLDLPRRTRSPLHRRPASTARLAPS